MTQLTTYTNHTNDQPTTCPECGTRTEFEEGSPETAEHEGFYIEEHKCLNQSCQYEFLMEVTL